MACAAWAITLAAVVGALASGATLEVDVASSLQSRRRRRSPQVQLQGGFLASPAPPPSVPDAFRKPVPAQPAPPRSGATRPAASSGAELNTKARNVADSLAEVKRQMSSEVMQKTVDIADSWVRAATERARAVKEAEAASERARAAKEAEASRAAIPANTATVQQGAAVPAAPPGLPVQTAPEGAPMPQSSTLVAQSAPQPPAPPPAQFFIRSQSQSSVVPSALVDAPPVQLPSASAAQQPPQQLVPSSSAVPAPGASSLPSPMVVVPAGSPLAHFTAVRSESELRQQETEMIVDEAVFYAVKDESRIKNVTNTVNLLIKANGCRNITRGVDLSKIVGDPSPFELKALRVRKGLQRLLVVEGGAFNLEPLFAGDGYSFLRERSKVQSTHGNDVAEGLRVDSATYCSASNESKCKKVTELVNVLIKANGAKNIVGTEALSKYVEDPAPFELKLLRATRGAREVKIKEGSVYDVSSLFAEGSAAVVEQAEVARRMTQVPVDFAKYCSVTDASRCHNVTDLINALILVNGVTNLLGKDEFSRLADDPAPTEEKKLIVGKSGRTLEIGQGGTFNVESLFQDDHLSVRELSGLGEERKEAYVDSAVFGSAVDASAGKSKDITAILNVFMKANGIDNITGNMHLSNLVGDPAPGEVKVLKVQRGPMTMSIVASGSSFGKYNLSPLFAPTI